MTLPESNLTESVENPRDNPSQIVLNPSDFQPREQEQHAPLNWKLLARATYCISWETLWRKKHDAAICTDAMPDIKVKTIFNDFDLYFDSWINISSRTFVPEEMKILKSLGKIYIQCVSRLETLFVLSFYRVRERYGSRFFENDSPCILV